MVIEKLKPTFSLEKDLVEKLKQLVPEAVADGKINWEILKEALGEHLEEEGAEVEHFGLNWAGKRQARRLANIPSKGTLIPVIGEGIDEENTRNIFIEGDNLEVLKLLQKSYAGRVKMIYIDPPYNTGNDFIYKDNFSETITDYLRRTGQVDEEGNLLTSNPKLGGRYHSNWLNMMYPRLRLARNLLQEDGVIFISIDENEIANLRIITNEIFGDENFLAILSRRKKSGGGSASNHFAVENDFIIIYAKNKSEITNISVPHNIDYARRYSEVDEQGRFFWDTMERSCTKTKPYKIVAPDGTVLTGKWFRSEKRFKQDLESGEVRFLKKSDGKWSVQFKQRMGEGQKIRSLLSENEYKSSQDDLKKLELDDIFSFPKPVFLIKKLVQGVCKSDDLILDFFSGSGTTAQAILDLNNEDNNSRNFICVQLPENSALEESNAYKRGYYTIAEIGKERIRRVIKKIKEEQQNQLELNEKKKQDLGFKVFKLAKSNIKIWEDHKNTDLQVFQTSLFNFENPLVEGWNEADVVTEIQLLEGFPLDSKIEQASKFSENIVHQLSSEYIGHKLFICLEEKVNPESIEQVNSLTSEDVFICLDNALTDEAKLQLADGCNIKTI